MTLNLNNAPIIIALDVATPAEARSLVGDNRYSSIAQLRTVDSWGVPQIQALVESTYFAGLRKAGVPEIDWVARASGGSRDPTKRESAGSASLPWVTPASDR